MEPRGSSQHKSTKSYKRHEPRGRLKVLGCHQETGAGTARGRDKGGEGKPGEILV